MTCTEVLPSPKVMGDNQLNALRYLGHAIYCWQKTYAGSKPSRTIDSDVYFDTLHILIALYEDVRREVRWEAFSPYSLVNMEGQT